MFIFSYLNQSFVKIIYWQENVDVPQNL